MEEKSRLGLLYIIFSIITILLIFLSYFTDFDNKLTLIIMAMIWIEYYIIFFTKISNLFKRVNSQEKKINEMRTLIMGLEHQLNDKESEE
ncbi:MAG: hypothetical protein PHO86_01450 [Bacilli bacterium]|nr:hypothetical protein [Bacilli bacterium]